MKIVDKPWGKEEWIEVNDRYVVKKITVNAGHSLSTQYHKEKHETFFVISGRFYLTVGTDVDNLQKVYMRVGDTYVLPPGTIHSMKAVFIDSIFLECSTPELDDIVRLKDDYGRTDANNGIS